MKSKWCVLPIVTAILLLTSTLTAFAADGKNENDLNEEVFTEQGLSDTLNMNSFIGDERAKAIALEHVGDGQVTKCSLSYQQGGAEYVVEVLAESRSYQFIIDAYTGNVELFTQETVQVEIPKTSITSEPEPQPTSTTDTPVLPKTIEPIAPSTGYGYQQAEANISADSAQAAALSKVGGGTVASIKTKNHRHGTEHKVVIVKDDYKYDVHVSANDGSVLKMKTSPITKVGPNVNNTAAAIDAETAKSLAIQSAGGGIITECKLQYKRHEGTMAYHIHVANGQYNYCVEVEATTGTIYKVEPKYQA